MEKIDFKKKYKNYFNAPVKKVEFVELPEFLFLKAEGNGDPNGELFQKVVEALYGLSYTLKFMLKNISEIQTEGYYDWVVPPLEGLWWTEDKCFDEKKRDEWKWKVLIMQPEFIDDNLLSKAKDELKRKKGMDSSFVTLYKLKEGKSAQIKHVGPYTTEKEDIEAIFEAIESKGMKP